MRGIETELIEKKRPWGYQPELTGEEFIFSKSLINDL